MNAITDPLCPRVTIFAAILIGSATCSFAGDSGTWYVRGGIGPALTEDTTLEQFFGPPGLDSTIELEPGIRFDGAAGYRVTDWFAVEGELGFIFNAVDSVEGTTDDDLAFSQSPFMVNVVFEWRNQTGFVPFIGGGGGGSVNAIYTDRFTLGGTTVDGSDADVTYIYQGFAGLRYDFDPRMGVSLVYKYSASGESSWKSDFGAGGRVKVEGFCTHAVLAAFTYRF